jgi:hypothetical protein
LLAITALVLSGCTAEQACEAGESYETYKKETQRQ